MVKILTDSSCTLTQDEAKKLGVDVIPLGITFGSTGYKDGVDIDNEQFYKLLLEGKNYPHTSQPSPQELEEIFTTAKNKGETVLFLPLSSKISGTYECAMRVKEQGGFDNVYIYDSLCTTIMLQMLVEEAAKRSDLPIDELIDFVDKLRKRARLVAGIDTLSYLAKGGRLNTATAAIGSFLQVKPLITISLQGTIDVVGKALGAKAGITSVSKQLDISKVDLSYGVRFLYSCNKENTENLISKMELDPSVVIAPRDLGPIVGAHIGPNAYGYVYVTKE